MIHGENGEKIFNPIVRIVKVDRTRIPQQALDDSGRVQHVDEKVVEAIPRGSGEKVELIYFKPGPEAYKNGVLSCEILADEYEKRGLKPDPLAQIYDNTVNSEFADDVSNACQWVDTDGNYCHITFGRWDVDRREVHVGRRTHNWAGQELFAGVRNK